jgi:hypothetical protein
MNTSGFLRKRPGVLSRRNQNRLLVVDVPDLEDYITLFKTTKEIEEQELLNLTLLAGMKCVLENFGTSKEKYTVDTLEEFVSPKNETSSPPPHQIPSPSIVSRNQSVDF